jgi:hypothetical protein
MTNPYYAHTSGVPATLTRAASSQIRNEYDLIEDGFDLIDTAIDAKANIDSPTFTGTVTVPTPLTAAAAATKAYVDALSVAAGNVPTGGSTGQYLVKDSATDFDMSWGSIVSVGTGGTTSTASITLTASSAAAMSVTPATPGLYVTLPDATTCTKADNLYSVYNAGDYDYGVKDSAGTQLGWIRARTGAMIGLADNSTAAGVWAYYGLEKTGITASYVNSTLTNMGSTIVRVALDANCTCFLFGGTDCYAIVYDASTQTWGSATLVASGLVSGGFVGVLSATNQVLVSYGTSTPTYSSVTLTIATNTVTVNTPVAWGTPAAAVTSFGQFIPVGASFSISYVAGTQGLLRALTVSGTVPSIGAVEVNPYGTTSVPPILFASGSVVRTVITCATLVAALPYTISGTTQTIGTGISRTATAAGYRAFLNGNGNIVCHYINSTHYATIFKLTGTTEAASSVSLGTAPGSMPTRADCLVVSASKTVFAAMDATNIYFNILTDTAGTASAGTQITFTHGGSSIIAVYGAIASGNTARFGYASVSSNATFGAVTVDCSAASPVMGAVQSLAYVSGSSDTWGMHPVASDKYGVRAFTNLVCGTSISINLSGGGTSYFDWGITTNSLATRTPLFIPCGARSTSTLNFGVTGASANESWCNGMNNANGTIGQQIYRVEAAA